MIKYALVTSTPGIGKYVFMYYAVWRLIEDKKRLLLLDDVDISTRMGTRCTSIIFCQIKANGRFQSPELLFLVHSREPTKEELCAIAHLYPNAASDQLHQCFLLSTTASKINAASEWKNRFECLGGVPRMVLQNIRTEAQALLMSP
ncbi:hypothetical protein PsorP6_006263 [Peronosclerospora sorghi]|uniref:Uncharacterized protein n=1 Tax=Peronosclerospora sorghi TaxID=230839 RepID=A0ACC0W0X6_9STRA|nr:hypothetical protein PsorP6_006263 [Peronosclerospora sorghi]